MTFDTSALFILFASCVCLLSSAFSLVALGLCLKLYTEIMKDHRLHDSVDKNRHI